MAKYMHPHGEGRWVSSAEDQVIEALTMPPRWVLIPDDVRAAIDLTDPDVDFIIDEVAMMRLSGYDMTDAEAMAIAVQVARMKAGKFHADVASGRLPLRPLAADGGVIELPGYCAPPPVVYYMRRGTRCKIGYTTDLKQRVSSIQPEELMATEPGGVVTEDLRHAQFAHLRVVGEWFRYEGALVEHAESLR